MTIPETAKLFEVKSHETPDEVRTPNKTRVEVVRLNGFTLGRLTLQPGWRWSECIKHIVKTDLCEVSHVGYVLSGRLTIRMKDGTQKTIFAGQSYSVPPGHEAWVEGNEAFVGLEMTGSEKYAKQE
jgi:mannose-6-phosphate isomerase-like protein (cupin superfamily)